MGAFERKNENRTRENGGRRKGLFASLFQLKTGLHSHYRLETSTSKAINSQKARQSQLAHVLNFENEK